MADPSPLPPTDDWPDAEVPADADRDELDAHLRAAAARVVALRPAATDSDPWRQGFHIQPPVGLLNDPNGLVAHDGVYHLCYQWHPGSPRHGLKHWAYLTSTDLVHWTDRGVALAPSDTYDRHGCYSGSGIVHDGAVHFLYTGNLRPAGGRVATQALARVASDGTVHKEPRNPVVGQLPGVSEHVRDPKVWAQDGQYWMVLGAQTSDLHGTAMLLRSPDLIDWTFLGRLGGGAEDPVGGYMWECPDLLRLPEADVLVISAQHDRGPGAGPERFHDQVEYTVGALSVDPVGFARATALLTMDPGPDFYAPQTMTAEDGRLILIGWMGKPDQPGQLPLDVKHPSVVNAWVHCLTVPRTVSLALPEGGDLAGARLRQWPVAELEVLRGDPVHAGGLVVHVGESASVAGAAGARLDLEAIVHAPAGARLVIRLRDGRARRPLLLVVDPGAGTLTLDRTMLGTGEGGAYTGTFRPGPEVSLRVLLDSSSVEVFVDGGLLVLSARIYPVDGDEQIGWEAQDGSVELDLTVWPMASANA